jgi:hypothetical protein
MEEKDFSCVGAVRVEILCVSRLICSGVPQETLEARGISSSSNFYITVKSIGEEAKRSPHRNIVIETRKERDVNQA